MRVLVFITGVILASCSNSSTNNALFVRLNNLQGKEVTVEQIAQGKPTVIYFLAPQCPLSEDYTLPIKKIKEDYADADFNFISIVPGKYFTTEEIQNYIEEFNLATPLYLDPDKQLVNALGAKITPEVFVLSAQGDVLYSGKIDNWYITLGRNRKKPTEFYLRDALTAISNNTPIAVSHTDAVGCYIE